VRPASHIRISPNKPARFKIRLLGMLHRIVTSLLLLVALVRFASAQIADVETSNKMASELVALLNNGDAKAVVAMASPDFLKEASPIQISGLVVSVHSLGTLGSPELILDIHEQRHYKVVVKKEGKPDRSILFVLGVESPSKYFSIGFAPYKDPVPRTIPFRTDNKAKTSIDRAVQGAVDRYAGQNNPVGISIAVLHRGKESFFDYGQLTAGLDTLPTRKTIYEIGSITKTMTGTLVAQAVLDGRLSLDDDIRKLLPVNLSNLEFEGKPVLLRHLVTHTSGLPGNPPGIPDDAGADGYEKYTHEKLLADLEAIKLKRVPGVSFSYSNMGAGLCGIILERAYGMPYESLLKKFVLDPLRMRDTGIKLTSSMDKAYASGHDSKGAMTDRWTVNGIEAAGAVRSSAADMLRFARLNLDEKNPAVKLSHQVLTPDGISPMGIFWQRKDSRTGGRCLTHEGGTGGFTSNVILMPERGIAVVVMMNSGEQRAGQLGYEIALRILNGKQ
jgi:CubicO group peptidase (beta-lactamase class C family)